MTSNEPSGICVFTDRRLTTAPGSDHGHIVGTRGLKWALSLSLLGHDAGRDLDGGCSSVAQVVFTGEKPMASVYARKMRAIRCNWPMPATRGLSGKACPVPQ